MVLMDDRLRFLFFCKKEMKRGRTLSDDGKQLLCSAYGGEEKVTIDRNCLSNILCNLFTTEYDHRIEECTELFRKGSKGLLVSWKEGDNGQLHRWMNNALMNTLCIIFKEHHCILPVSSIKQNVRFYLQVAKKAMETKDHNTAILLKSALAHSCVERLNILSKNMKDKMYLLEKEYGSSKNCQKNHIDHILNKSMSNFSFEKEIPSPMVLEMYLKRVHRYEKALREFGKFHTNQEIREKLHKVIQKFTKQELTEEELIPLYTQQPDISLDEIFKIKKRRRRKTWKF